MNNVPQGFFSPDINNYEGTSKLPFFPAGFVGDVRVCACRGITPRPPKPRAFIAELEVVTSNIPDVVRVGGKYSWYQGLGEPATAYRSCIAFVYACLGLDSTRDKARIEKDVKPQQDRILNAFIETNAAAGTLIRLQTSHKLTKEKKLDFTVHTFSPAPAPPAVTT